MSNKPTARYLARLVVRAALCGHCGVRRWLVGALATPVAPLTPDALQRVVPHKWAIISELAPRKCLPAHTPLTVDFFEEAFPGYPLEQWSWGTNNSKILYINIRQLARKHVFSPRVFARAGFSERVSHHGYPTFSRRHRHCRCFPFFR